ncbi:hypothetical protein L198_07978 [Cryptococcus wingfieldii CBS 7118]|uniref:Transmembrane protein n=1 Tax=Cryptococcus wingfieldii CBS 7118 TaxID=1295528 RepID=A0A1E3HPA5_9TREE|nr:hypothetical protein L198_07978 [Cryptococcus wingfieldii CBS 7118]ODN78189.1 hypothetical protein L198_07978 [Cryptococcus wingfieldii CBS 7118]
MGTSATPTTGQRLDKETEDVVNAGERADGVLIQEDGDIPDHTSDHKNHEITDSPSLSPGKASPAAPSKPDDKYTHWASIQISHAKSLHTRPSHISIILTSYCLIAQSASLYLGGGWLWWMAVPLAVVGLVTIGQRAEANEECVDLVRRCEERMRFWAEEEKQEAVDTEFLSFLNDSKSPPSFQPIPSSILLFPYEKGAIPGSCMSLFIFSLVYLFAFYSGFNGVLFHVGGFGTFLSTFRLRILFGALSMMGPLIWYLVYYNRASATTRLDIEGARYRWAWHKEHMGAEGVKALEEILPGEQVDYLRRFFVGESDRGE